MGTVMWQMYMYYALLNLCGIFLRENLQSKTTASQNMDFLAVWVITGYLSGAVTDGIIKYAYEICGKSYKDVDIRMPLIIGFVNGMICVVLYQA